MVNVDWSTSDGRYQETRGWGRKEMLSPESISCTGSASCMKEGGNGARHCGCTRRHGVRAISSSCLFDGAPLSDA